MPLTAIGRNNANEDLKTRNSLNQMNDSMSEKLLASPDIVNGILMGMTKSDMYSESEDSDKSEFEEPDDLHEFFGMHSVLAVSEHNMAPCCISCGKKMELVEGDIIYGEHWYHGNCWKVTNKQLVL